MLCVLHLERTEVGSTDDFSRFQSSVGYSSDLMPVYHHVVIKQTCSLPDPMSHKEEEIGVSNSIQDHALTYQSTSH